MCSVCGATVGHYAQCPIAPDPPAVGDCEWCNEPIESDDWYEDEDGKMYHKECMEDNAVDILMEIYNLKRKTYD